MRSEPSRSLNGVQWVFKYTEILILTCTRKMESLQLENQSLRSGVQSLQSIQNDEINENGKRRRTDVSR